MGNRRLCSIQPYVGKRTEVRSQTVEDCFTLIAELFQLAHSGWRFAQGIDWKRSVTATLLLYLTLSFVEKRYMKNAYKGMVDLNTAEFDNWLEPTTSKIVRHAKSNKNKLWGDFEGSRTSRRKKRDARSDSWVK